jgi:DeoR/GlpR family transcriptional regulator of sugar metabolism
MMPEERRRRIARLVREVGSVTIGSLEAEFGISPMTARRDLGALEEEGLEKDIDAKERLAEAAVELLEPGTSVFLDSSTSAYYLARRLLREGPRVTLLTNSVPVMELFMREEAPKTDVVGVGGLMRKLTLSFVGPHAVETISAHSADKAFISVKGIIREGYLTDPDLLEAQVKRAMTEHCEEPILIADGSKFEKRGLSVVTHVSKLSRVLLADAPEGRVEELASTGVEVRRA